MIELTPLEWFGYIWLAVMFVVWIFIRGADDDE